MMQQTMPATFAATFPVTFLDGAGEFTLDFLGNQLDPRVTFSRASSACRVNASGLLESVTTDVARFDYDPLTLAHRGLLIEEARTNLMAYSEDLSSGTGGWTNDSCTVAGTNTAPDGTVSAQKITEAVATAQHRARKVCSSYTADSTITISVFLKAAGRRYASVQFGAANGFRAGFDLTAGTVVGTQAFGTGTYTASGIVAHPNGWYRCYVVGKEAAAATSGEAYVNVRATSGFGGESYLGDGASGLLAWGYQVEVGTFPTSYIKTTSATVTRAADVATVNTLTPWFNHVEGAVLAELSHLAPSPAGSDFLWQINDGSNANYHAMHNPGSPTGQTNVSSAVTAQISVAGSLANNTSRKLAYRYRINDFQMCNSGTLGTADVSGAVPTSGLTTLRFGRHSSGAAMSGHYARWSYWPQRLPDAILQGLTA